MGFSSQRDTFVPVTTAGEPIGRAIASADRRAGEMVAGLGPDFQVLTGVVPDAGTVAAKVAWIRGHEPDRLSGGQRWIMGPRDLVAFRLTGRGRHRHVGRVTDRLARPGRGRPGRRGAPPGGGRPDDHHRRHPPGDGGVARRACRHTGRGRCRGSRVRAARRRGDDRPTDGVVGLDRRGVRPGRARPATRSGDRRLARRAGGIRDGSGSLRGGVRARRGSAGSPADDPTSSRTRPTRSTPGPRDSWRWRGSAARALRGGRRARGSRSPG